MAPSSTRDLVSSEPQDGFTSKPTPRDPFDDYRRLVPLVAADGITHLNAGFMPPSNLVVHEAVTSFCAAALHHPSPKPLWKRDAEALRHLLARYTRVDPSSLAFVRDTTEGLGAFMHALRFQPGDNVVILACEHPNQAYGWLALRPAGLEVRLVPTLPMAAKEGKIESADADTFAPYVDDRTRAIGLSSVMFHTGQLNDVAGVCARFRPQGIHVLADLTQHVGFADVDIGSMGVSAAAFSMHKGLNTPTGIAALYMDPDVLEALDPVPPLVGYGAVANTAEDAPLPEGPIDFHPSARRYEHANMGWVNAVAGRAFVEFYLDVLGPRNVEDHLYRLGDALRRKCATLGVEIAGPVDRTRHSPHLYVLRLHDERWLGYLRESSVVATKLATGIRVSFGFYNSLEDVDRLFQVIEAGVQDGIPLA